MNQNDEVLLIYGQIKEWVDKTEKPNASNIIVLTTLLIKCVEEVAKDKSGSYKKDLVIKVLRKVINESKLEENAKASLLNLVETVISITIDTMIAVANGKLNLGKTKEGSIGCLCF